MSCHVISCHVRGWDLAIQGSLGLPGHYGAGTLWNKDVQRENGYHGLSRIYGLLWGMGLLMFSIQLGEKWFLFSLVILETRVRERQTEGQRDFWVLLPSQLIVLWMPSTMLQALFQQAQHSLNDTWHSYFCIRVCLKIPVPVRLLPDPWFYYSVEGCNGIEALFKCKHLESLLFLSYCIPKATGEFATGRHPHHGYTLSCLDRRLFTCLMERQK